MRNNFATLLPFRGVDVYRRRNTRLDAASSIPYTTVRYQSAMAQRTFGDGFV
jgi:hypothetical protein